MDKLMTVICFVLLFVIVIIPIFMIIYNAFFFEGKFELNMFVTQLTDSKNLAAMWNTLKIALFATIFGTIMGVFYAWLLGRSVIPCKGLMRALFSIPYMFPPFLGAMAWDLLLNGRSGYLNRFLVSTFGLDGISQHTIYKTRCEPLLLAVFLRQIHRLIDGGGFGNFIHLIDLVKA